MPDGKTYAVVMSSRANGDANVRLTFYTKTTSYALSTRVDFNDKFQSESGTFYGAGAIYVELPTSNKVLDVCADLGSDSCSPWGGRWSSNESTDLSADMAAERDDILRRYRGGVIAYRPTTVEPAAALSCADPYVEARTVFAAVPRIPADVQDFGTTRTSKIVVVLTEKGTVDATFVYKSSGFSILDAAATTAARASRYSPEVFRCKPVGGRFIFVADFEPPD